MFLQPRSSRALLEASGGGAGCGARGPCLASTGPERLGDPPWGKTTPRDSVRYRCRPRPAPMLETRRQRESPPQAVQRRAERRRALRSLRQGDAHARQGVHTLLEAPLGAPPLDLRGQTPAVPRRGTRDGHPRGRPTPRRISLGCLTSESNHSAGLVSRMRCSATSAFTRVFDALWRCTADPGPRLFVDPSETGVPGLQRTTSCCAAPGTRV